MKAVPQHTLPLATTAPFTRWSHAPALRPGAWSDTLEQAWRAGDGMLAARPDTHAEGPRQPGDQAGAASRNVRLQPGVVTSAAARHALAPRFPMALGNTADPSLASPPAPVNSLEEADDEPQAPPARPGAARSRASREGADVPPVRVHVEQQADGVAVWLGVCAGVDARTVASVLASLRHALPGGLTRFTCNGLTIYDRLAHHQEKP